MLIYTQQILASLPYEHMYILFLLPNFKHVCLRLIFYINHLLLLVIILSLLVFFFFLFFFIY